jgi:PHP family Zn ribbon phosphoesterase
LSPCGDDDITPANIAGMAMLKGLNVVALSDHNTAKNCPAFFECCRNVGIVPIAGMEITTLEDIHVLALFESLSSAMEFDSYVSQKRILFENDASVFGNQFIVNANDEIVGEEKYLLINAVDISVDDVSDIVKSFTGIALPAHIDKTSNGIISVLGTLPDLNFTAFEFSDKNLQHEYVDRFPILKDKFFISNSDAHYLWDINERINSIKIFSDLTDFKSVTEEVFAYLKGEKK